MIFVFIFFCLLCENVNAVAVALQDSADIYAGRIYRGEPIDVDMLAAEIESIKRVLPEEELSGEELDEQDLAKMKLYFYDEKNVFQRQTVGAFEKLGTDKSPQTRAAVKILTDMVCDRLH